LEEENIGLHPLESLFIVRVKSVKAALALGFSLTISLERTFSMNSITTRTSKRGLILK